MITPRIVTAVGSVTASSVFTLPPGPCTVLLASQSGTVFVGPGTAVSTASGFPVTSGAVPPVSVPVYPGCPAEQWSAVVASGTSTLALLISSPIGGTGP